MAARTMQSLDSSSLRSPRCQLLPVEPLSHLSCQLAKRAGDLGQVLRKVVVFEE